MNPSILDAPSLPWRSAGAMKLVADGNSITAGTQDGPESNGGVPGWLNRHLEPFKSQGYANSAIGGQTISQMISAASDVDGQFDASKVCVLFVQEGTNEANTSTTPEANCQKVLDYCAARRATHPWACIAVATAPPVYLGDALPQSATDAYNVKLDRFNNLLRQRWPEVADALIETRCQGSPYAQARYPNYLKTTFFSNIVVDGISNNASFITEPTTGPVPDCKIHYTAAGISILAPLIGWQLLRAVTRRRSA